MKLGRPLAQQSNRLDVCTNQIAHFLRNIPSRKIQKIVRRKTVRRGAYVPTRA